MTDLRSTRIDRMGRTIGRWIIQWMFTRARRMVVERTIIETVGAMNIDLPRGPDS